MAVKTIGSGGDYSSPQAWEDSLLAVLLEDEEGQCLNQEFTGSYPTVVDFSAHDTTLGTLTFTAAAGASFQDNADVRTNELRYNAANGAGIKTTDGYTAALKVSGDIPRLIISRLQFFAADGDPYGIYQSSGGAAGSLFKDCLIQSSGGFGNIITSEKVVNCLFISPDAVSGATFVIGGGSSTGTTTVINCAAVVPSNVAAAGTGFLRSYRAVILKNCAVFGFSNATNGSFSGSSANNATDLASGLPGSSNQHSVTYSATTPFVQADSGSALDFRLADDANALIDNGVLDATNAPNDISGLARTDPCEIGVWELASGTDVNVTLTGVSLTASTGSPSITGSAAVSLSGVSAAASPGTVTVSIPVDVALTGLAATMSAGSPTATGTATINPSGVAASASAGDPAIVCNVDVALTGVAATGSPGAPTETASANVVLTGVAAVATDGSVTVNTGGDIDVPIDGVEANSAAGDPGITGDANVSLSGQSAIATAGTITVLIVENVTVTLDGHEADIGEGTLLVRGAAVVTPLGVSAAMSIGDIETQCSAVVYLIGIAATSHAGRIAAAQVAYTRPFHATVSTVEESRGTAVVVPESVGRGKVR